MSKAFLLPRLLLITLLMAPISAHAQTMTPANDMPAGNYMLDKTHASLIWKVSHAGLTNYAARFTDIDATLTFDPQDPTKSKLIATVNPLSIQTDYPAGERDFNKELSTDEKWFNAVAFPKIRFESTRIEKTGEDTGKVYGNLTLLGVTKPLALDVTFNGAFAEQPFSKSPTLGFSATGSLTRSDWGLDTYTPLIGDEVTLQIEAELVQSTDTTDKK